MFFPSAQGQYWKLVEYEFWQGFGGMVTFYIDGGLQESKKFLESLK